MPGTCIWEEDLKILNFVESGSVWPACCTKHISTQSLSHMPVKKAIM